MPACMLSMYDNLSNAGSGKVHFVKTEAKEAREIADVR